MSPKVDAAVFKSALSVEFNSAGFGSATKSLLKVVLVPPKGVGALVGIGGKADEPDELELVFFLGEESEGLSPPNGVGASDDIGGGEAKEELNLREFSDVSPADCPCSLAIERLISNCSCTFSGVVPNVANLSRALLETVNSLTSVGSDMVSSLALFWSTVGTLSQSARARAVDRGENRAVVLVSGE
jgi:hypothetical protein